MEDFQVYGGLSSIWRRTFKYMEEDFQVYGGGLSSIWRTSSIRKLSIAPEEVLRTTFCNRVRLLHMLRVFSTSNLTQHREVISGH